MIRASRGFAAALLTVFSVALAGCAALFMGVAGSDGLGYAGDGPSKLRIAIYEPRRPLLVPHAAMVIHAPEGHLIYDPAGWTPDPRGHRRADVTYSVTPEIERAFLLREEAPMALAVLRSVVQPESWELYLFETEVSDEVASEAARLARDRPALPKTGCALGVSTLLRQLPGYEDINPCWLPSTLLRALKGRDDLTLTQTLVPLAQGG
ncbi:MAG: hypothetical protein EA407_08930 [Rhodobacteraceae bacterium]|nr:MAG: hypothetical protein EA407_08930 [Paracoccaceae bacterium]